MYANPPFAVNFNPHNAMFYPNSYLNFNSNGYYTKHYYNGMERIASRLGDQNISINVNDPELQDRKDWQDSLIRKNIVEITGYEFLEPGEEQTLEDPKPVFELPQVGMTGLQPIGGGSVYYYHGNHLGSTAFVTDQNQTVVQGFLFAPFGEITNEYNNSFGNGVIPKYSFNAKELDEETGMYYYEARYMAPPVFTSRDPLFEKYPTFSPYTYCANNPVKYVDPDGRAWIPTYNEVTGEYTGYQWIDPKYSYNSDGTLKDGFYEQAIFFSENGTYNPKSLKNIGSSTATVYKSDGTTETFDACTYPSDVSKYATVPAGIYTAKRGIHNGSSSSYPALKIPAKINLGAPNPSHPNRDYAEGIDIHKSGINNFTGIGRDGNPVSEGCLLIDINKWNRFLNCFTYNTEISVTVSRTMSAPTNKYVKAQYIHIPILTPSFPADKTRVNVPIKF